MFSKKLVCLFKGHDEKLSIDHLEPHPQGGYYVTRSHKFCWRCGQDLS